MADALQLRRPDRLINASCPGETSGSFLLVTAPDNGCNGPGPQGQPPFKTSIGLHDNYTGAQQAFAITQLRNNRSIDLVTLSIGGNDILLLVAQCAGAPDPSVCVGQRLPAALGAFAANLDQILTGLRQHYSDTLVVVQYFSPVAELNDIVLAFNGVMAQVGARHRVKLADGFATFQLVSALFQGDPCKAGLLVRLSPTTCDVHPSDNGQRLLAATVAFALLRR